MANAMKNGIGLETPDGAVVLHSFCTPEEIGACRFDDYFGGQTSPRSFFTGRERLEACAAETGTNVVLALTATRQIVGFGVFGFPEPDERWSALERGIIMEVKAVEVCRPFRAHRIAGHMLGLMMTHPRIERMIAFMVGYSWTWDLAGSEMTALQYRGVLVRLFGAHGFSELRTNEPNVCLRPENLFMGRVGGAVDARTRENFKYLRFGLLKVEAAGTKRLAS